MKTLCAMLILSALSGCSSVQFENRIVGTLAGDELSVQSKWGPFGITSKISDKDRAALIQILGTK